MTAEGHDALAPHDDREGGTQPPTTPRRHALVVLGMHRSGTSALTGALRLCGAFVGEDEVLTGASAENPKGFWERRDLREICDALLHGAGADWWKVAGFEAAAVPHVIVSEQGRRFRDLVGRLDANGTWIVKEPRLCLLFPLLRPYIADPVCLIAYRHPMEVAQSLRARNGFGISEGLALWEAYMRSALRVSAGLPRLLVSYERLVGSPHDALSNLVGALQGLGVAGLSNPDHAQVDGFITPSLRRQRSEGQHDLDFLTTPQRQLWDDLQSGRALEPDAAADLGYVARQHLRDLESRVFADRIKSASEKTDAELADLRSRIRKEQERAGAFEAAHERAKGEIDSLRRALSAEEKGVAAVRAESEIYKLQASDAAERLRSETARIEGAEARLAEAVSAFEAERAQRETQRQALENDQTQAAERLRHLEERLQHELAQRHETLTTLDTLRGDLEARLAQVQTLEHHAAEIEADRARLLEQSTAAGAALDAERAARAALEDELRQSSEAAAALRSDLAGLAEQLGTATGDRGDLHARLQSLTAEREAATTQAGDLQAQLSALTDERHALQEQLKTLDELLKFERERVRTAKDDSRAIRAQLDHREAESRTLRARISELLDELHGYGESLRAEKQRGSRHFASVAAMREQRDAQKARIEELKAEVAKQKKLVKDLKTSTSWRLMGPMRRVSRLAKRLTGRSKPPAAARPATPQPPAPALAAPQARLAPAPAQPAAPAATTKIAPPPAPVPPAAPKPPADPDLAMRRERAALIARAESASAARQWQEAIALWGEVFDRFGEKEDVSAMARFNLSVAKRCADIPAYRRRIDEYRRGKAMQAPKIAIYTAISGAYDSIKLPDHLDPRFDYVLFADQPVPDAGIFDVRPMPYQGADDTRSARFVKAHPHMLLPGYDTAIWIDANVLLLGDIQPLLQGFLDSGRPVAAVPHPVRTSLDQELEACIARAKDEVDIMTAQVEQYRAEGFTTGELIESNLMMFDLRSPRSAKFLDAWWTEIDRHSKRDQLSANYAFAKAGVAYHRLMAPPMSVRTHPAFALIKHQAGDVAAALPDALGSGRIDPHAGSTYAQVREERIAAQKSRKIDIVVCVHNALEDVTLCLDSVRRQRSENQRLIIIDDGSDAPTADYLRDFAREVNWVELQRNEQARGYTVAANMGLAATTGDFVILLNSDTIVTDGWAEKMADAVFSTPGAGLVGPLSNAASYQSIPDIRGKDGQTAINALPEGVSPDDINRKVEEWAVDGVLPRVPLVHGFCYGITREAIDRIGTFDEENFPRGYGEENDYCFRAVDAGLSLVLATHTYVFHAKSKSYGTGRSELTKAGTAALRRLHTRPRIDRAVKGLEANRMLLDMRDRSRSLA